MANITTQNFTNTKKHEINPSKVYYQRGYRHSILLYKPYYWLLLLLKPSKSLIALAPLLLNTLLDNSLKSSS